jgi:antitoxin FitA
MSKVIQIRGVPDAVHQMLALRAAAAGLTLSDYVARELVAVAGRESNADALRVLATLSPMLPPSVDVAEIVRSMREEREEELAARVGRR